MAPMELDIDEGSMMLYGLAIVGCFFPFRMRKKGETAGDP